MEKEKIIYDTPEGKFVIMHKEAVSVDELVEIAKHLGIVKTQ